MDDRSRTQLRGKSSPRAARPPAASLASESDAAATAKKPRIISASVDEMPFPAPTDEPPLIAPRESLGRRLSRRMDRLRELASRPPPPRIRIGGSASPSSTSAADPALDSDDASADDDNDRSWAHGETLDDVGPPALGIAVGADADHHVPGLARMLRSSDPETQLAGAIGIRRLLSRAADPPIAAVADSGAVPRLAQLLSRCGNSERLTYELLWSLTNVASSTAAHTALVVDAGAVEGAVDALCNCVDADHVFEQALWLLSNVAGNSRADRDLVCALFPLPALTSRLLPAADSSSSSQARPPLSLRRHGAWFLSNMLRFKPYPFSAAEAGPILRSLVTLARGADEEALVDACWALRYASRDERPQWLDALEHAGALGALLPLATHRAFQVQLPATKALTSLCVGESLAADGAVAAQALAAAERLARHRRPRMRREACALLSALLQRRSGDVLRSPALTAVAALMHSGEACDGDTHAQVDDEVTADAAATVVREASSAATAAGHADVRAMLRSGALLPPLAGRLRRLLSKRGFWEMVAPLKALANLLEAERRLILNGKTQQQQQRRPGSRLSLSLRSKRRSGPPALIVQAQSLELPQLLRRVVAANEGSGGRAGVASELARTTLARFF